MVLKHAFAAGVVSLAGIALSGASVDAKERFASSYAAGKVCHRYFKKGGYFFCAAATPRVVVRQADASSRRFEPYPAGGVRSADGTQLFPAATGNLTIACRPGAFCQIAFPPGERIIAKALNDTVRWDAPDSAFGKDASTSIVVVKTRAPDTNLRTQLVVFTNGSVGHYTISLYSSNDAPWTGTRVGYYYPVAAHVAAARPAEVVAVAPPPPAPCSVKGSGAYQIADVRIDSRPISAYSDGEHVCIEMPRNVQNMPVPYELDRGGDEDVNYRLIDTPGFYGFRVDGTPKAIVLVEGTGKAMNRIGITRRG